MGAERDEAALVAAARAGDEAAFAALCARYRAVIEGRVSHFIRGALNRRVSVQDVLQESYLVAHTRLGSFDDRGPGAFGGWLLQIAEWKAREAVPATV